MRSHPSASVALFRSVMGSVLLLASMAAAGQAHCQSLGGISIGDTVEAVRATLPSAKLNAVSGRKYTMLSTGNFYAAICDGRVFHVGSEIGNSIHDFAAAVDKETIRRGRGDTVIVHGKSGTTENSMFNVSWVVAGKIEYTVEAWASGDGVSVSEHYSRQSACGKYP